MQAADRNQPATYAAKRFMDILLCLFALPVLFCLTLVMSLYVRFASPGPVFFKQVRMGYRGRKFYLLKFRTMHVNADSSLHKAHLSNCVGTHAPMEKMDAKGDKRLFFGGWLLRASGLDELPQIINVLRGEMSVIGPRPCLPFEFEHFFCSGDRRFEALPGLTGLWQVSGKNETTFEEMIALDRTYLDRMSFRQDLRIVLETLPTLIAQTLGTWADRRSFSRTPATHRFGSPQVTKV